jgi:cytochrome P450
LEEYRKQPTDNLLSEIANGTIHGRPISIEEALSMAHNLVIAGNETTRNALSSAMFLLARRPDLWQRLKSEPSRIADFIEELLRLYAPALTTARQVMADTEINGIAIPKGSCLFLMWGSASADEQTFADSQTFDLERRNKRMHMTFGMGLHHCVGKNLARAEMQTAITAWLRDFERVELAKPEDEIRYAPIFGFRALVNLPMRVTRTRGA